MFQKWRTLCSETGEHCVRAVPEIVLWRRGQQSLYVPCWAVYYTFIVRLVGVQPKAFIRWEGGGGEGVEGKAFKTL